LLANAHPHHALETRLKQFAAFSLVADACSVFAPRYPVKMKSRIRGSEPTSDVPLCMPRADTSLRPVVSHETVCGLRHVCGIPIPCR
jgi:hypothetical protein